MSALARSAPEKPAVAWAIFRRFDVRGQRVCRGEWTFRIASRPSMSGAVDDDLAVETAGTQQGAVEDFGTVGRA